MDLADQIDDYICSFEGIGDLTMDSLAIFIFIWAVLALFSVWLCKFLYNKYLNKDKAAGTGSANGSKSNSRQNSVTPGAKNDKIRLSEPREVGASKAELLKDFASKPGSASGGRGRTAASPGSAGAGGVRRRVVRQSSTGPENRKKRYVPPPSNVVGPEGTSVTWTSQVFRWLYSDLVIVNELLMSWVIALNDSMHKSMEERLLNTCPGSNFRNERSTSSDSKGLKFGNNDRQNEKHGVAVEIVRVLPDSPAPGLSNIFCNCDENNPADMVITYDCDAMPVLQVKTFRQKSGKMETSHYKVTVSRFRARMACAMNYNTLKGEMRVEGYPDVRIAMNSVGAIKPMDQDEQQLQAVISEILTHALRDTIYPVDFSMNATCPRAEIDPLDIPVIYPLPYDALASNTDSFGLQEPKIVSGRRLLIKIVKGEGIKDAKDPYVVIEMDEPPQKNQTSGKAGANPYWDEHFLFELAPQSAEILFEVYDRPANATDQPKFLGLGLVGIDEVAVGPASTQTLALQPRPYEPQQVFGAIIVDFVFIEGAEIPAASRPYKLKEALRISTPAINEHIKNGSDLADAAVRALQGGALAANGQPNKSTVIIHSVQRSSYNPNAYKVELNNEGIIEVKDNDPYDLNAAVTNAFENDPNSNTNHSISEMITTTTTTTTSNSTQPTADIKDKIQQQLSADSEITTASPIESYMANEFNDDSLATTGNTSLIGDATFDEFGRPNAASSPHHNNYSFNSDSPISPKNGSSYNYNNNTNSLQRNGLPQHGTQPLSDNEVDQRGRSKKRNFFGTLKKRLSRSKPRTQSVDRDGKNVTIASPSSSSYNNNNGTTPTGTLNGDSRSLSVDRAVMSKTNSLGRRFGGNTLDNSRRSSISESSAISGFSSASNKTYVHEASTLVLETIENGIKRHFIVPLAIAQRPKWRRKGTKLHIYNDHTFIAKHLSGSGLQCSICMKSIPRRPGKQGYECRDCHLVCHKQCHVRAPQACPNPTVLSMELTRLNSLAADRSIRKA